MFSFQKPQYLSFLQFCTLLFTETFTVPLPFNDTLTWHSSSVQLPFLYFFLAIVAYFGFPLPGLYHSKFLSLNCFFFSSQASLLSSIYPLETASLSFSCFTQVIFLQTYYLIIFFFFCFLLIFFRRGK